LKERIDALEARPSQKWAGIHAAGVRYSEASIGRAGQKVDHSPLGK
jgi:hypothetical protein